MSEDMKRDIPTREEREEAQHEEDCCCMTCETRPFLAKIADLEQRLEAANRVDVCNLRKSADNRPLYSPHGVPIGSGVIPAITRLSEQLAAAESMHLKCAEQRNDALRELAAAEADLEDYRKRYYAVQDRITTAEADTARLLGHIGKIALEVVEEGHRGYNEIYYQCYLAIVKDLTLEAQIRTEKMGQALDAARKEGKQ